MDTICNRDGIIIHTTYWRSAECQQGSPYVLARNECWHLLLPRALPHSATATACVQPVTQSAWMRCRRWHWKLEIVGESEPIYIKPHHFIGPPVPLPASGTCRPDYQLYLYLHITSRHNTELYGRLPLRFLRAASSITPLQHPAPSRSQF